MKITAIGAAAETWCCTAAAGRREQDTGHPDKVKHPDTPIVKTPRHPIA